MNWKKVEDVEAKLDGKKTLKYWPRYQRRFLKFIPGKKLKRVKENPQVGEFVFRESDGTTILSTNESKTITGFQLPVTWSWKGITYSSMTFW